MTTGTVPLRHAASVLVSNVDKKSAEGEQAVRLVNYTDVYYRNEIRSDQDFMAATATYEQSVRFRVQAGDSIITKDSETPGDIAVPTYVADAASDMVSGYHLAIVRPMAQLHGKYLYWALASDFARQQFAVRANGMTRFGLTYDAIQSVRIHMPPLEEQRRIADFLDDQVTRIDAAVELRRLQRDAVHGSILAIAHSEVAGVSSVADRKTSSIPWIDLIPRDWGTPRVSQVARMGTGHTPSRSEPAYWVDCDIPWLTTGDVHRFRHDEIDEIHDTVLKISRIGLDNSAAVIHPRDTVALSRTASAGFSIVMREEMATSQDFATWTPGANLDSGFLLWCLRAMRPDLLGRLAMGSTHKTIYFPDLGSIRIPLPPLAEQRRIVRRIQQGADAARASVAKLDRAIELIGEFKRSLITAAVTGELDVVTARRGVPG